MKRKTGFFFDERCFWHSTGLHAVTLPVGGWVQPPAGGGHAESPETKRRMKNLMDVSGLTPQLALRSAAPASLEDLRRIHPDSYLERFKTISDNGGGMLGKEAPLGPAVMKSPVFPPGWPVRRWKRCWRGSWIMPIRCRARPDTTVCRTSRWDFVSSPIFPLPSSGRKRSWGWARWRSLTGMFTTATAPSISTCSATTY
ncbi:hypothetical protein BN1007_120055 [Klebsiella variicola]|nr:hypothetical protein BN1007_120055 [Klebsiella variicola]